MKYLFCVISCISFGIAFAQQFPAFPQQPQFPLQPTPPQFFPQAPQQPQFPLQPTPPPQFFPQPQFPQAPQQPQQPQLPQQPQFPQAPQQPQQPQLPQQPQQPQQPLQPAAICSGTTVGYVADPRQCDKFYLCVQGLAIPQDCPRGYHFSSSAGNCILGACSGPAAQRCPADGVHLFPIEKSCTTYTQCFLGVAVVRTCSEGLQFDSRINQCNLMSNVKCLENNCPTRDVPGYPIISPDPGSCDKFYICNHGKMMAQGCPANTLFQKSTLRCEHANQVRC